MAELKLDEARVDRLDEVLAFVDGVLEQLDCPLKAQMQLDVAVEELFVNIASYAYAPGTGPAALRVDVEEEGRVVAVTFVDQGVPYDPLAKPDPDITLSAEERQPGGLGIFMVKRSMDDMAYRREGDSNVLTIRKRL